MRLTFYIMVGYVVATLLGYASAGETPKQTVGQTIDSTLDTVKRYTDLDHPNNRVTVTIKNEWEDIKAFQRKSWHEGEIQLEQNRKQISGYWENLSRALGAVFGAKTNEASSK